MKKSFRFTICIIMVLVVCMGILCACNNDTDLKKRGEFYNLKDAYENGLISKEDLKNISYYQNGELLLSDGTTDSSFVPTSKNPAELSKATSDAIKETYAYNLRHDEHPVKDAKPEDVYILNYCGSYSGYVAIRIDVEGPAVMTTIVIDDVVFIYGSPNQIVLFKEL